MRPQEKIIELIYTHLHMIRETVVRNGNLRAEFFRNIWMVEKVRKNFDDDEIELFRKVYAAGKEAGEFEIDDVELTAAITHYCIKGLGSSIYLRAFGQRCHRHQHSSACGKICLWSIRQEQRILA